MACLGPWGTTPGARGAPPERRAAPRAHLWKQQVAVVAGEGLQLLLLLREHCARDLDRKPDGGLAKQIVPESDRRPVVESEYLEGFEV